MKTFSFAAILTLFLPAIVPLAQGDQPHNARKASRHISENLIVTGEVLEVRRSKKGNIFLYLGDRYPHQSFTVFIASAHAACFSRNEKLRAWESQDAQGYDGKTITVSGKIVLDRGKPQIEITSPSQIKGRTPK
jgi:DNA/RNA endonuclease YhcR with UshA esterase domain